MNATPEPLHARVTALLQRREGELRGLLAAGDQSGLRAPVDGSETTDFKDAAARESLAAVQDVQSDHAAAELAEVLAARRRLADGTFGLCGDCGEPIAEARLLALPATSRCAACQTLFEQSAGRTRSPSSPHRKDAT